MNAKIKRQIKIKQRRLTRMFLVTLTMHLFIVITILTATLVDTSENNKIEGEDNTTVHESEAIQNGDNDKQDTATPPANVSPNVTVNEVEEEEIEVIEPEIIEYDRGISDSDKYLLAKLAMAEAEGESLETKVLILMVVINRTEHKDFPDTIEEVIFEKTKDLYQFSPIAPGGRWWTTEPNEECFEAVQIVNSTPYDISDGALYFEACSGESWHSRNLTLICESDNTRFYK